MMKDTLEIEHITNAIELKRYLIRRLSPLGYNIEVEFNDDYERTEFIFFMWYGNLKRKEVKNTNCITYVKLTHNIKTWFQEWIDIAEREYVNRTLISKL